LLLENLMTTEPRGLETAAAPCGQDAGNATTLPSVKTRRAFVSHMRHELLAPVEAIIGYADALRHDAQEGPADFVADIDKMLAASKKLYDLVERLIDPDALTLEENNLADKLSQARHDIGNQLNQVVGYCQLLMLNDEGQLFGSFQADLEQIRKFCTDCEKKLLYYKKAASDPLGLDLANGTDTLVLDAAAIIVPSAAADPAQTRPTPGLILVVEDNEASAQLAARLLRQQGHSVALAANGRIALEIISRHNFDVVLMDILMPEMNGYLALKHLKANPKTRHIPVIMVSALDEIQSVVRCIEIGAEDYLPKPIDRVLLDARLNACLEKKRFRDREVEYLREIQQQKKRADELLHVILPAKIVEELKATNAVKPHRHEQVAVLFADIVGFTPYCDKHQPEDVLASLQQLAVLWEEIALRHQVEKIKTIGDALMAACGLLLNVENPVLNCIRCGQEMIQAVQAATDWNVRIGIHIGPVVAGVLGQRQYLFDLWGDTVNTAARMESHGVAGQITLTRDAWEKVRDVSLGEWQTIHVKGKGDHEVFRLSGLTV
jgi:class 3 adenylate cyclase